MVAFRHILFISLLTLISTSCTGTRVVESWSSQSHAGEFKNIFIIGFVNEGSDRMLYESIFSVRLAEEGIDSRTSHTYAIRFDEIEQETILEKISSCGCDAVLLTRVVGQRNKAHFDPTSGIGTRNYSPRLTEGEQVDFSRLPLDSLRIKNKTSGFRITPIPPTGTSFDVLTVESLLYDTKTEELIWSTRMETDIQSNRQETMQNLAEEAVRSLKAEGLI